jgi:hypothetical protein
MPLFMTINFKFKWLQALAYFGILFAITFGQTRKYLPMIYIKELFPNNESVLIKVDGVLDKEAIPNLKDVFIYHLEEEKMISVDLTKLLHISREGKAFLQEFKDRVIMIQDLPI